MLQEYMSWIKHTAKIKVQSSYQQNVLKAAKIFFLSLFFIYPYYQMTTCEKMLLIVKNPENEHQLVSSPQLYCCQQDIRTLQSET